MKSKTIVRMESKNRPGKGTPMAEMKKMNSDDALENLKDSPGKGPHEESENKGKKSVEKMQKPKDEEEHVDSTLHTGN